MNKPKQNTFITQAMSLMILFSMIFINIVVSNTSISAQKAERNTETKTAVLNSFTTDITDLARNEKLRLSGKYKNEVNRLVKLLSSNSLRQPALLDQVGESQELVVEELASRIAKNDVPANLQNKRVLMLEVGDLYSTSNNEKEVSSRINTIIDELTSTKGDVILFVDELTNFVGRSQVSDKLTNAILKGNVKIIGGASKQAYIERIDSIAQVSAVFEPIMIGGGDYKGLDSDSTKSNKYRGDNVSTDLRELMKNNPSGKMRLDVILQTKDADNPALRAIMAEHRVRLSDRIGTTDTMVVNLPLSAVTQLSESGFINYMSPDRPTLKTGHVEDAIGLTQLRSQESRRNRNAYTLDGEGIGVAVMDSGIYENHKAFKDHGNNSRIVASQNFVTTEQNSDDDYGHGTHVAGIIAAKNTRNSGAYTGIAPGSHIINVKVLDGEGRGRTSWLLNGLDWLINNHAQYNIRVVNMSLGTPAVDTYTNNPINIKVQRLNELGVLVVAAAGNEGKTSQGDKLYGYIHSPGNDPSVLTVGAVNTRQTNQRNDDVMATFSSRGPTRSHYVTATSQTVYDNIIKPDMVAPGNRIASARSKPGSYMPSHYPSLVEPGMDVAGDDNDIIVMSGTSMSTPVVAGAAALLFQVNPNLTPQMVKMIFEYTAQPLSGYNMLEQGAGQLNLEGAVRLAKNYRTDIDFNTVTSGSWMYPTGVGSPTQTSTINGETFNWSRGIITNYSFMKGSHIISRFHNVYKHGSWFDKGVTYNTSSGSFSLNGNFWTNSSMTIYDDILISDGNTMSGGQVFCEGETLADGVVLSDGVVFSDGVIVSDGVIFSDGIIFSDGVIVSDRNGPEDTAGGE